MRTRLSKMGSDINQLPTSPKATSIQVFIVKGPLKLLSGPLFLCPIGDYGLRFVFTCIVLSTIAVPAPGSPLIFLLNLIQ